MEKISKIVLYVAMALSIIVFIYFAMDSTNMGRIGTFLMWSYILLGVAIVLSVSIPLFNPNPQALKKMFITTLLLALVIVFSYVISSDAQTVGTKVMNPVPAPTTMKLVDMEIKLGIIMLAISLLAVVYGFVLSWIRNR